MSGQLYEQLRGQLYEQLYWQLNRQLDEQLYWQLRGQYFLKFPQETT